MEPPVFVTYALVENQSAQEAIEEPAEEDMAIHDSALRADTAVFVPDTVRENEPAQEAAGEPVEEANVARYDSVLRADTPELVDVEIQPIS